MDNNLTYFQKIRLELLWYSCRFFAILPYHFRYYVVENIIFTILYLMRYRMAVVKENLRNSFPDKSEKELRKIRHDSYWTLAEIFVDTISMAGLNGEGRRVINITNLEEHREKVLGTDWIAMAAHFGCWEYYSFWGAFEPSQMLVAVYHPMSNPVFEAFYRRLRTNDYSTTVSMNNCLRYYVKNGGGKMDGKNIVMGLISDQNAPLRPDSHWFRFLNQDTLFFDGGAKLALRYKLPTFFIKMERSRRGRYDLTFDMIYDGKEELEVNELIERYVRRLETMIENDPGLWMWSHRRWKFKKEC